MRYKPGVIGDKMIVKDVFCLEGSTDWGTRLAQLEEQATLSRRVVGLSPTSSVKIT